MDKNLFEGSTEIANICTAIFIYRIIFVFECEDIPKYMYIMCVYIYIYALTHSVRSDCPV